MKLKFICIAALLAFSGYTAFAQDEFSDEDLNKYASVMKWAESEKAKMGKEMAEAVKADETLSGAAFNKLRKAKKAGDVNSTDATPEELAAFNRIEESTDARKAEFKLTYTDKIKSEIGAGLYNRLKKALKTDEDLKARYQVIYESLEVEEAEESEE